MLGFAGRIGLSKSTIAHQTSLQAKVEHGMECMKRKDGCICTIDMCITVAVKSSSRIIKEMSFENGL